MAMPKLAMLANSAAALRAAGGGKGRSAARQALAAAQEWRDVRQVNFQKLKEAGERHNQIEADAARRLAAMDEKAKEKVDKRDMLARALSASGDPVSEAEALLQERFAAEAQATNARALRQAIDDEIPNAMLSLSIAESRITEAVAAVLAESDAIPALVAKVTELQQEVVAYGALLEWIIRTNVLRLKNDEHRDIHSPIVDAARLARNRFTMGAVQPYPEGHSHSAKIEFDPAALDAWKAAAEALKTNPDAPLPSPV